MTDIRDKAKTLLEEYELCRKARPRGDVIEVQIEKDACLEWAAHLYQGLEWGSHDSDLEYTYNELETRMKKLRECIVIEVLRNGIYH